MIPQAFIESWRHHTRWQTLPMVEQDLIITRALVSLYNHPHIKENLVFRGGTALNKLFIKPPARYSEDIDLVQSKAVGIGPTINAIRDALMDLMGEPKRKITARSIKLTYKYVTVEGIPAKLKIEINTTEHFQVLPIQYINLNLNSDWFQGNSEITTYSLEELMATKLRALFQRRKGRDLFDLWYVLKNNMVDAKLIVEIFREYCLNSNEIITRKLFEENLEAKRLNNDFRIDMDVLLPAHELEWDFYKAIDVVRNNLVKKIV